MPPHCDSLDGPVVTAARAALAQRDVRVILPYVKASGEAEVRSAFERAIEVRNGDSEINELADLYFFETVVRVHRAGEGAPYTGLKPAGLPVGPVIPVAERAVATGDPTELIELLVGTLADEVRRRLDVVSARKQHAHDGVIAAREYVEAMLGLEVWAHHVYERVTEVSASAEGEAQEHAAGHVH
jgi:hypothetical protein